MSEATLEQKRKTFEISFPSFNWKLLITRRFLAVFIVLISLGLFSYWYIAIRPFFWINEGYLDALSMPIRSSEKGKIGQIAVCQGDRVKKGDLLFTLANEGILQEKRKIIERLEDKKTQSKVHKQKAEKAMQDYLASFGQSSSEEIALYLQTFQDEQFKVDELQREIVLMEEQCIETEFRLEKLRVYSPADGVVYKQEKEEGQAIEAGNEILSLFNLNHAWIEVRVPEQKLHLLQLGQKAKIHLTSYPGREWIGKVAWIAPATVAKIQGYTPSGKGEEIPIKISIPAESFPFRPGLTASVGIQVR